MSEDLPFGSRGGLAVQHHFPVDGEYLIKIRLQRTHASQIRGLAEPNDIEVRLDRRRVKRSRSAAMVRAIPWSSRAERIGVTSRPPTMVSRSACQSRRARGTVGVAFPKKSGLVEGAARAAPVGRHLRSTPGIANPR